MEVLNTIAEWIQNTDPRQRIFWINGGAGVGKSAIAQTIAESCKDKELAASFFFERNAVDRSMANRLFPTLAWQLATSIPEIRPYLESALKTQRQFPGFIEAQFDQLFVQVFKKLLHDNPGLHPQRSLIFIDAVDECESNEDQKILLALIGKELASQRIPLRFIFCSRAAPHIQEMFNLDIMKNTTHVLMLDDLHAPNDIDVRRYLEDEMTRVFTERNISTPYEADEVIHRLVLEASGQFIYASTVIKFLDDSGDHNPRTQLDIILNSRRSTSSYTPLVRLYMKILTEQQSIKLLKGIFALIYVYGYVDLDLISQCLWTNRQDLKLKLRRTHSLLNISDSGIKHHHLSFLDFLTDRNCAGRYSLHPLSIILARFPSRTMTISADYAWLKIIVSLMAGATIISALLLQSSAGVVILLGMVCAGVTIPLIGFSHILFDTKERKNRVLGRLLAELAELAVLESEEQSPEETTATGSVEDVLRMRSETGEMMDTGHEEETEGAGE